MRIIIGFAAGGVVEIVARLIGQSLSDRLGRQFITENRPGAGGNTGIEAVVRAPPDGYTLLIAGPFCAINAAIENGGMRHVPLGNSPTRLHQ